LNHPACEERLRELATVSLEKKRLVGVSMCTNTGKSKENGHKQKYLKFHFKKERKK